MEDLIGLALFLKEKISKKIMTREVLLSPLSSAPTGLMDVSVQSVMGVSGSMITQ